MTGTVSLEDRLAADRRLAGELAANRGKWVATRGDHVVASADSLEELLLMIDDWDTVDGTHRVAEDPNAVYVY